MALLKPSRCRLSAVSYASWLILLFACFFARTAHAVHIKFENCLPDSYRLGDPLPLQWEPLLADARFDTESDNHNLRVIVWGNVTGSRFRVDLPPPDDPAWEDPEATDGKILRIPDDERPSRTTLVTQVDYLSYGLSENTMTSAPTS